MKNKFRIMGLCLLIALLSAVFFSSCNEDPLGFNTEVKRVDASELATRLIESTISLNEDLLKRNPKVLKFSNLFSSELDQLSKATSFQELEQVITTTAIDIDLLKIKENTQVLEEISSALEAEAFNAEDFQKQVELQSQHIDFSAVFGTVLRSKMKCLRDYDNATQQILAEELACTLASVYAGGVTAVLCGIDALVELVNANIDYQNCIAEVEANAVW